MCGIIGVLGRKGATRIVHEGLQALEYRGYDSCGVAWTQDDQVQVARTVGAVAALTIPDNAATTALGHTRWATHGGVTEANAHPHQDCDGRAAVVHNGVLLNHQDLRQRLEADGHTFRSETDSESLAHLWEASQGEPPQDRLRRLHGTLEGTFSVAVLDADEGSVFIAKHRNPLWVAHADGATYFASDAVALRRHVKTAIPLEDGDHGILTPDGIALFDAQGRPVQRAAQDITHLDDRLDHAGYEHYMLKEIHETPTALNHLLTAHVRQVRPYIDLGIPRRFLRSFRRFLGLGAGTSWHAGLLGSEYLRRIARIPADARPTPEYKDDLDVPERATLLAALSQSGETLDTLQALHRLRSHPHPTLALTNQPHSSIGRFADETIPLRSGVEVSVAATKTFLSQSLLLYLLALAKADVDGRMSDGALAHAARRLILLPRALEKTLRRSEQAQAMARALAEHDNLFLLAKGLHLPAALEGALKLKEIAYQHAEAYPAGELKHGPFALLTPDTPVVFLLAPDKNQDAVLNSLQEVHARGAPTFVVAMDGARDPGDAADQVFWIPAIDDELSPFVFTTALHLLSYWVAKARGLPIDKPRNLAKSVTVE